jgi:hypothetical protein
MTVVRKEEKKEGKFEGWWKEKWELCVERNAEEIQRVKEDRIGERTHTKKNLFKKNFFFFLINKENSVIQKINKKKLKIKKLKKNFSLKEFLHFFCCSSSFFFFVEQNEISSNFLFK